MGIKKGTREHTKEVREGRKGEGNERRNEEKQKTQDKR